MVIKFLKSLYSKEGSISSKRFFGSLVILITVGYLGFIIFGNTNMIEYEFYCWTTAFITSAILVGGDTIKDLIKDIFNMFKKK